MAMKKRFYTVDGQMVGYEEGGVRKDFLTDHLGSIIAIMDENEVRVFDTRYSAYGRNRWITGTGCGFGWVGSYGYRETGLSHMSHYVRARHYSYTTGSWSTVDPLWPDESAYGYVGGRVILATDPSGQNWDDCPKPNRFKEAFEQLQGKIAKLCDYPRVPGNPIYECWKKCGEPKPAKEAECFCKHATGASSHPISFGCYWGNEQNGTCFDGFPIGLGGVCMGAEQGWTNEPCRIRICPKTCSAVGIGNLDEAIFHEIMHCCSARHSKGGKPAVGVRIGCLENCLRPLMGWKNRDQGWPGWPKPIEPRDVKCTFK